MTDEFDLGDDELQRALQALGRRRAEIGPVPGHLHEHAEGLFDWGLLGTDVIELIYDSAAELPLVATRAPQQSERLIVMEGAGWRIVLQLGDDGRLLGEIEPVGPASVVVRSGASAVTVACDEEGHFETAAPAAAFWIVVDHTDVQYRTPVIEPITDE